MKNLTRITFDPNVMGGKPCIRGLRVTVGTLVGLVATGYSTIEILTLLSANLQFTPIYRISARISTICRG